MKKLLLILVALVQVSFVFAQSFPVRVTPQAIPPYPTNLSGYANSGLMNSPLRVQLVLSDVTASSREVRLAVSIEGNGLNATSAPVVIGAPTLILDGGIPLNLTIAELAPYFEQQNLQGLSSVQYNNPLPDGMYRFCFDVFDAFNGNRLSANRCATVFLINNDPPFLNKPDNESKISEQNPTNIIFQWTPRHINVPNVSYEFSIVEVWDPYIDPQAIFLSSPPLYQEVTTNTSLLYGPIQPLLLAGKRYAWRVRAFATNNGEEVSVFNNNGNSEVFWFDYQGNCELPTNIEVRDVSMTNATISWVGHPEHLDFTVEYREAGNDRWYKKTTPRNYVTIDEFKPDTIYEYRIVGNCTENSFGQTPTDTFRTLSEELAEYASCGIDPDPVDLSNQELLTELLVNDVFTAGDFPVYVKDVSGSGSFTGEGYISTPWLATVRIPVKFENIKINTDMKLVDGFVVTTYDPTWGSIIDADEIIEEIVGDDGDVDVINIDVDIVDIEINEEDGTITIVTSDGQEITRPGGEDVVYVDNTGETWSVSEDGDVTQGEQAEGGPVNSGNTNGIGSGGVKEITSTDVRIEFAKGSGYYNFDQIPQNAGGTIANKYDKVPIAGGGEYNVPYKAISNLEGHTSDILIANATFNNSDYTKDDVIFKTKEGIKVQANWNGDIATLSIRKAFDFGKQEIIATIKPKDSTKKYSVAGSANLWHLASQEVTDVSVTIIPVNNVSVSNSIAQQINAIYNPAGVNLAVTVGDRLNIDQSVWDLNNNGQLDLGDSSLLAQYTEEERAINAYFKTQTNYNNKTYYIFVTDLATTDSGTAGFMPLKRQYGFIFDQNNVARTIAHELGHGIFGLEHPFTEYDTNSGATDLLMDYGTGTEFNHMDWEKMHAPGIQLYWFQGDEDGEQATVSNMENLDKFKNENGSFTFISMSGKPISLPGNTSSVTFSTGDDLNLDNCEDDFVIQPFGSLKSFKIDNVNYSFCASCNSTNFAGYFKQGTGCASESKYIDIYSNEKNKNAIVGLPCVSGDAVVFKAMLMDNFFDQFDFTTITSTYNGSGDLKAYDYIINEYGFDTISDDNIVYVPADFNPRFEADVINFLASEFCFCDENDFTSIAYGFVYATQLQKNKDLLSCFNSDVPLFFYDENVDADKFHYVVVNDWQEKNINGFTTLKNHVEKFKKLSTSFSSSGTPYAMHDFLMQYVPEQISTSNANSYNLRFGTTYWESGVVLDKIKNISDSQLLRQYDDVFCLWESIPFDDRISALNYLPSQNRGNDRTEEILLYLIINETNKVSMMNSLKDKDYTLFWKIWDVLDFTERSVLISYLNENLISETTKNAGKIVYDTFIQNCVEGNVTDNTFVDNPCDFNKYKILPVWRANSLGVVNFAFDISDGGLTEEFDYSLETSNKDGNVDIVASTNYIDYSELEDYWEYFTRDLSGGNLFDSTIEPFLPIVLIVREDIKLNGKTILEKDQIASVPAIFLHWLDSSIDSEQNQVIIRVAADGLVVASIFATGGATTPLLALDLAIFGTDFVFTIVNESSDSIDPEVAAAWDAIYNLYSIANIPRAVASTSNLLVNGSRRFITFVENSQTVNKFSKVVINSQYLDDYIIQFRKLSDAKKIKELELIDNLILAVKNTPRFNRTAYVPRSLYRNLVHARLKIFNSQFTTTGITMGVEASVNAYSPYLKIFRGGTSSSIANIVYPTAGVAKPTLESVRWLPATVALENTKTVGTISDITFNDLNEVSKNGALQIVEDLKNRGQFYLALEESFITVLRRDYPKIYNKVSTFSEPLKSTFIDDFKDLEQTILTRLNNQEAELVNVWEKLHTQGFPKTVRTKIIDLFDSNNNPQILLKAGNPIEGEISMTFNWQGEEVTEALKIINDSEVGKLRFRFKNFVEKGHIYKFPIRHGCSKNLIPQTPSQSFPTSLNPKDIKLMQVSIRNDHDGGPYFVLKNAYLLKTGQMSVDDFFPIGSDNIIQVWKNLDPDGFGIWSVDHRRLVASILGDVQTIPVRKVENVESITYTGTSANSSFGFGHGFKMSTVNDGVSINIRVHMKDGKFANKSTPGKVTEEWKMERQSSGSYKILRKEHGQSTFNEVQFNDLPSFWD
ncbi:fibronectin type III domain-containing protein [Aquimarina sp. 2201CG14-23]|uniref:fibronectin type III domain-containing protein n=1 Tax=Aquimarina mycalae TaxID=3040073 RepID=UPI002477CFE8|nr:fibronectin type III domain-containing protein [Aquimarina sp. 2201CG14-23]MDH7445509.1 hypothetical protein [Aquimarina sp. 2201CG14-23]